MFNPVQKSYRIEDSRDLDADFQQLQKIALKKRQGKKNNRAGERQNTASFVTSLVIGLAFGLLSGQAIIAVFCHSEPKIESSASYCPEKTMKAS